MGLFDFLKKEKKRTPAERFLDHLSQVFGQTPVLFSAGKSKDGLPAVSLMLFHNVPEKGFVTGVTYGLSLGEHPEWKSSRPELCISVASPDEDWAHAVAYLAGQLRGDCPFTNGLTIKFSQQISKTSKMDAFFISTPSVLELQDYKDLDIGLPYRISIAGLYPMYAEELEVFEKIGLDRFWKLPGYDMFNVSRKPLRYP
jgi:hypothetical protein